jgi:membrane protease YdiL (CAAX protease family)
VFSAAAALLVFYGAVVALAILVAGVLSMAVGGELGDGGLAVLIGGVALTAAGWTINVALVRAGLSKWPTLGWHGIGHTAVEFGRGTGLGVAMASGALLVAIVAGDASVTFTGEPVGRFLGVAGMVVGALTVAALGEELVFRGYPLARLARVLGPSKAAGVLAALFALMHVWNPEVSPLGLVNIGLASLVMSAAFFTRGGLPLAWGLHLGWNAGLAVVDAPVSGIRFGVPVVDFAPGGWTTVTGGAFGPEGGVAATVAMMVALAVLVRRAASTDDVNAEETQ